MTISQDSKKILLLIAVAYLFSVAVRFIWIYQFHGYEPFMYNGQFMINTNDGYYWAEGARDLLSGVHQEGDLSPIHSAASQLTYFFAKILPFSFESIIFYMPVYLSSLIVIPVILISYSFKRLDVGFVAALLSSIAWSYYNRTMAGYYDTDMLNIVIPIFLLWSLIWAISSNQHKFLLITALDILLYRWWYPQSYSLEFAFFGLILFYTLVFDRKNLFNFKLLAIMLFAMMMTDTLIRLPLVVGLYFLFKNEKFDKYVYYIFGLGVIAVFATGGFMPIWGQLKGYVFRETLDSSTQGLGLHFFTVMQTVREAGHISFTTFANRISGNVVTLGLSVIGYAWLSYRYRVMLLALPLIGLGFLALNSGLRFTIYAIVPMAFGIAFIISEAADRMPSYFLQYATIFIGSVLVLLPNIVHIKEYKVPTVFNKKEVSLLEDLKKKTGREDYVVSWWDYGYPLRYYSDLFTLVDGGKHSGEVNFPVSYILTSPQEAAARMARMDVEYNVRAFAISQENKKKSEANQTKIFSNIEEMTKAGGFNDTNDFLSALQNGKVTLPKKTRDIYFFLPYRMLGIYPTITLFSNLDLMSGDKFKRSLFFFSPAVNEDAQYIYLQNGIAIGKSDAVVKMGNESVGINRFIKTWYAKDGKLQTDTKRFNVMSNLNVIYMASYGEFLIVDEATFNSLYIQLFVLEHYDKNLFEAVEMTPYAKIYKLKI
ncbi:STT3 domain-containing protein [Sulfurimonas sp. HSL-1716]|uniref:STT3 domain-containing protein n=1 Tax=Hydrocurvibacter sulfurireducens TaxID=3131937 RepID=UPI0031F73525